MADALEGIEHIRAIAWDLDGVLNRDPNRWQDLLAREYDLDTGSLNRMVFAQPRKVLCGEVDILDRLEAFAELPEAAGLGAEEILEAWFEAGHNPDDDLLRLMELLTAAGLVQVLATNNEARRIRYLMLEGGWSERVDGVFASGEMGAMKPEAKFFETIEKALNMAPAEILLVDDKPRNNEAADKRGWLTWDYAADVPAQGAQALARALMPLLLRAQA
ncbi:MAG: HAD-IA family hydrolase [Paracoccaceae bacterium]